MSTHERCPDPKAEAAKTFGGVETTVTRYCPPQHAARLEQARAAGCPGHGCPLCAMDWQHGTVDWCAECYAALERLEAVESPPADPWCVAHGVPTAESRESCRECVRLTKVGRARGWLGLPTGHSGIDCLLAFHCYVCGMCMGRGVVCGDCRHCSEHQLPTQLWSTVDCQHTRWSRSQRAEVLYLDHRYYDKTLGRWRR